MTNGQSSARDRTSTPAPIQVLRERVTARRRARGEPVEAAKWMVTQSRRQKVRTVAVCAGTLLLMALGLYLGLAHQESTGSLESAAPIGAAGIV